MASTDVRSNEVPSLITPMTSVAPAPAWGSSDWRARLAEVADLMREMSNQSDPQEMVRAYGRRIRQIMPSDRWISLSRRGLRHPQFRITRSSLWEEEINPWTQPERLPVLEGGLLADLLYGDQPRMIDDLDDVLNPDDPAADQLAGMRSLMAIPHYHQGEGLNLVVTLREKPGDWETDLFPERFWISSLFGRATQNLVLSEELRRAYDVVDRELRVVADIQRSLLPKKLPEIPGVELATFYRTSQWAGGDYYDFFELPNGRWGILIADVSGHGTPAAVMMAILHSLAHGHPGHPDPPSALLQHVNQRLAVAYTTDVEVFVTAFYGIYDPASRTLTYACAGHNPPRVRRCTQDEVLALDAAGGPPLGIFPNLKYEESSVTLIPGDCLILYTDGVTEAMNADGDQFTPDRLDALLGHCSHTARQTVDAVVESVDAFTGRRDPIDDQTLVVARIS